MEKDSFSLIEYTKQAYHTVVLHINQSLSADLYHANNPILHILVRIRKILRHKYNVDIYPELHIKKINEAGNITDIQINFLPNTASIESDKERRQCQQQFEKLLEQKIITHYLSKALREFFNTDWYRDYYLLCRQLFVAKQYDIDDAHNAKTIKQLEKSLKKLFRTHMHNIGLAKPKKTTATPSPKHCV